jgi:hypothetical protein
LADEDTHGRSIARVRPVEVGAGVPIDRVLLFHHAESQRREVRVDGGTHLVDVALLEPVVPAHHGVQVLVSVRSRADVITAAVRADVVAGE